jgi:hypothetical protein
MVSWHFLTFHRTFGACPCSPSGHVPLHYPRRIIGYASAKVGHGYNMLHVHFVCILSQSAAACSTGSPSPNPSCPFRGTTVRVVKSFPEPVLPCKQATLFPMDTCEYDCIHKSQLGSLIFRKILASLSSPFFKGCWLCYVLWSTCICALLILSISRAAA